jgi:hypothetical protein
MTKINFLLKRNWVFLILLCLFSNLLVTTAAMAEPPSSTSLTHIIKEAKTQYGINYFRMVMPGALYRGGSCGERTPLPVSALQKLCNDDFKVAVYVYSKGWSGSPTRLIKCGKNEISYIRERWDHPQEVHQILKKLHDLIIAGKGAMYVHCWYGVHASGYVATVALMQFCNLSPAQGVVYWNSNTPKKLQYSKVQNMIYNFKRDPALQLTKEQQARVCPKISF